MLEKIANLSTFRNFTRLSKTLIHQGNTCTLRCFSSKIAAPTYSTQLNCLPKPVTFKNTLCSPLQLTKVVKKDMAHSTHGNHVTLWKLERIVSAAFLPLVPLAFLLDSVVTDSLLAVLTVMHIHWGLEAIIIDYARPIVVGKIVPKICMGLLYVTSVLTLAGLMVLVFNGPGISKVIKQGWAIGKDKK